MIKSTLLQSGQKFNRLTIIKLDHIKEYISPKRKLKQSQEFYICKCDCGNECIVMKQSLLNNRTKSCGCFRRESFSKIITKHNMIKTRLYGILKSMKRRCYNKNFKFFKYYGGRDIVICDEWLNKDNGFISFYNWAMDNGYEEDLTIDRINNNGNYEPSNCRWTTQKEQSRNKRNNHLITYNGETHCISEWAEIKNINYKLLSNRINKSKWSAEKSLNI